jgi:4-amino-4-deoxy-L-arabinose transferase-like glycosyltransferase
MNKPFVTSRHTTILLFSILLFVLLILSGLVTDGMFFDGIAYADVARNLAIGEGNIWDLHYTKTFSYHYHDQPPLTFLIQAIFFKCLGTSIFVERFYCFVFALLWIVFIAKLFSRYVNDKSAGYFPIILWMTVSIVPWTFQNNLQEVTMGFFTLCGVYFALTGMQQQRLLLVFIAGVFTFCASFCKGAQGLFPIVAPFLFYITYRTISFRKTFEYQIAIIAFPIFMYALFFFYEPANTTYTLYAKTRLVRTFSNQSNTTSFRFQILIDLLVELIIPMLLSLGLFFWSKKKQWKIGSYATFMVLMALSASLPLTVTMEQRPFYLTPSIPFYILALAAISYNNFHDLYSRWGNEKNRIKYVNIALVMLLFIGTVVVLINPNNPKRDKALLHDIYLLNKVIPEGSTISIADNLCLEYHLHAYMNRYGRYSLETASKHTFFLAKKKEDVALDSLYGERINGYQYFDVYKLK